MAIQNIIAKGIGFSPGDTHFIVTHGFTSSSVIPPAGSPTPIAAFAYSNIGTMMLLLSSLIPWVKYIKGISYGLP
jgi:hypothetical protein